MLPFRHHCMLASVVIAAAMFLGGDRARAGYISVDALPKSPDGFTVLAPWAEMALFGCMEDACKAPQPRAGGDNPSPPSERDAPLPNLLHAACDFGLGQGAGNSSGSASDNGPTSSAGDLPHPQLPPPQLASLLPPQTGAAHLFSFASFLFRPPRAM